MRRKTRKSKINAAGGNGKVEDFRHKGAKRVNNPPAGLAPIYEVHQPEVKQYFYDPHLDPQLVWAGKAEHTSFEVDVLPLHIHERVSTRAILAAVKKPEPQLALFGNQELTADKQIEFYQHEIGWANRLILGDSLLVMNSLLIKEGMAGKVQCIYIDPPYGIKYASNMQPRIDQRDVKDKDDDLTREPEQINAYRDTWKLGIHSYLTYLRDRLLLARELLHESGSIFVQINDENLHLVRCLMDEVFGRENFVAVVSFVKTSGFSGERLDTIGDFLLWYSKDKEQMKYHKLYLPKEFGEQGMKGYDWVELPQGTRRRLTSEEKKNLALLPAGSRLFKPGDMTSQGVTATTTYFIFEGRKLNPGSNSHWKTTLIGMQRLLMADRLLLIGNTLSFVRYADAFPVFPLTNIWSDTGIAGYGDPKLYVVQTNTKVVERCILMTTDPGDLVFDPTCGSGTTAYCAEKWGRRWITCDTSRVALAIARQRLLTARFDYFELLDPERGPAGGFKYETVPHITLESIAKNSEIDVIAEKYQPEIDEALKDLNKALGNKWQEWEVPREADRLWNKEAKEAHRRFWELKRAKRQEIDASIQRNAPQETLYDRPFVKKGVVRVSGPFTVEAIPPPVVSLPEATPIPQYEAEEGRVDNRAGDYIMTMVNLLKQQGGIVFPGGKRLELKDIRPIGLGYIHAQAEAEMDGAVKRVAISFGPKNGPVTAYQVRETIDPAIWNKFDILLIAGFSFAPDVHSFARKSEEAVKGLTIQCVNITPDVLIGDLLKASRASQIFTVFGEPDVEVKEQRDGTFVVELKGVDIYDPVKGEVHSEKAEKVAAWFLDTDYDGMTFHICQAFFPGDPDAWDKLQRALKAQIEPSAFEKMRGTQSFPFKPGEYKRIAVKVIDFRGNEVVRVVELGGKSARK
ncbi:site-specific DNA-methyltransferase [candidate division WOR-3 bacterium]|nr:site-specific DNA-methyltransferase [candidate division WOR-3 bacterium]